MLCSLKELVYTSIDWNRETQSAKLGAIEVEVGKTVTGKKKL